MQCNSGQQIMLDYVTTDYMYIIIAICELTELVVHMCIAHLSWN